MDALSTPTSLGRSLAWAGLYLLVRFSIAPLSPLPLVLPLDPWLLFIALAYRRTGTVLFPVMTTALLLGDAFCGLPLSSLLARGLGAAALLVLQKDITRQSLLFLAVHGATWTALPPELRGEHAFVYIYLLALLQGLLWCGMIWPWTSGSLSRKAAWLLPPLLFVGLIHQFCSGPRLWPLPRLGDTGGTALRCSASLLLIVPFIMPSWRFLMAHQGKKRLRGRWTHLAKSIR